MTFSTLAVIQDAIIQQPIDVYTAIIATLGVALWYSDRKSLLAALHATTRSELTSLRMKKQDREAAVERSFAELRWNCQSKRDDWENHRNDFKRTGLSMFRTPKEDREIIDIEEAGHSLLAELKKKAPRNDCTAIEEYEAFIVEADRTAVRIDSLSSRLKGPKAGHY